MALLEIRNVTRRFGNFEAVRNVSFEVSAGEFFTLLGPSGCGKTTILRMVAGFDLPDEGSIVVVESCEVEEQPDSGLLLVRICGSHFLWRMVRRLAGTLVKVGLGQVTVNEFKQLLAGRATPKLDVAAWTAPASGLFLENVRYPSASVEPRGAKKK